MALQLLNTYSHRGFQRGFGVGLGERNARTKRVTPVCAHWLVFFCYVARSITRAPELCTDLEVPLSDEAFEAADAAGAFALTWRAHGTAYGVRKDDLEGGLERGQRLVANVSRGVVPVCLSRYGRGDGSRDGGGQGHEVYCLLVTAPNAVRESTRPAVVPRRVAILYARPIHARTHVRARYPEISVCV
jgi:hypothetical protein